MNRFGVVGLGSMGKRRVRDLLALGGEVVGFDIRDDRTAQSRELFGIETVDSFEALLAAKPDALVLSVPPDMHAHYYEKAFEAKLPFFSEASIFSPRAAWFAEQEKKAGIRTYPSATWQFYPPYAQLREELRELGMDKVQSVQSRYAWHLATWHPWEPYSEFYAGKEWKTSAAREMVPFEMEALVWVFGPVKAVNAVRARTSEWVTDVDDTYLLQLEFESGLVGTLSIEMHQVAPYREIRVSCREDSFLFDFANHELKRFNQETGSWKISRAKSMRPIGGYDFEQTYFAEMQAFYEAHVNGVDYPKNWEEDRHLSNILCAAEISWRKRAWVALDDVEPLYDGLTLDEVKV